MRSSSNRSEKVYILKPVPSPARGAAWALAHAIAVVGAAAAGLPAAARFALIAAVLAHARYRAPPPAPLLLVTGAGRWSVPAIGLFDIVPDRRSAYTRCWARLVLGRPAATLVLLRPEYQAADWRRIQLALRRAPSA